MRFAITARPLLTLACHCKGCQRMSGGPYSVSEVIPGAGFEVTAGEPVLGGLRGEIPHFHCPDCMSWVFTRVPPPAMPMVNVRATLLDDASGFVPFCETCTDEMLPWAKTPAVRSYPAFPPAEDWPAMIAEYRQRSSPPA